MVAAAKKLLGVGIYTIPEAAFYARMPSQTLRNWFFHEDADRRVLRPELGGEKVITFLDFMQCLTVRAVRTAADPARRVSLAKIRQAVRTAEQIYKVTYPLARKHTAYLFDRDVFIRLESDKTSIEDRIVQVSGKHVHSQIIPVLDLHLDDIVYGPDGLPERFRVFRSDEGVVTMDPHIAFGEPLLPSGYTAMTIWDATRIEGSIPATAKAYGLPEAEVRLACRCYDYLIGPTGVGPVAA